MGVDAEILIKKRGRHLTEAEVLRLSYDVASTLGHNHFFITRGREDTYGEPRHAISILRDGVWHQDGPPIEAQSGEQFLRMNVWSRYYGPQYARGDWAFLRSCIEWAWKHIPDAEVWYGGDSSGICAELMDRAKLQAITDFWLTDGRNSYLGGPGPDRVTGHQPPTCPCCEVPMRSSGGGRGDAFWFCSGCGRNAVTPGPHFSKPDEDVFDFHARLQGRG